MNQDIKRKTKRFMKKKDIIFRIKMFVWRENYLVENCGFLEERIGEMPKSEDL